MLVFPVNPDSNGNREVIRCHSFRIREGVQYDVQAVWPLLAGVRPNDPNLAPPFVDPRETLENKDEEGVLDDEIPMFPSPVRPEPAGVEPAASSAGAEPSASVPVDPGPEYTDVDLKGDDEDDDEMGVGLIEDHCIHYYHQIIWNDFASIDSMMVGKSVGKERPSFRSHTLDKFCPGEDRNPGRTGVCDLPLLSFEPPQLSSHRSIEGGSTTQCLNRTRSILFGLGGTGIMFCPYSRQVGKTSKWLFRDNHLDGVSEVRKGGITGETLMEPNACRGYETANG